MVKRTLVAAHAAPRQYPKAVGAHANCVTPTGQQVRGEAHHNRLAREYLNARGITLEQFELAGGEVVQNARAIDPIFPRGPALILRFFDPITGKPMTFTDERGQVCAFQRVRPLGPQPSGAPKFLQPRNSGVRVYFAVHPAVDWATVLADPCVDLVLTEGETRSLAGAVCDPDMPIPVVSITGVDCGQLNGGLQPDLAAATLKGRRIFCAFDSDVARKPEARAAIDRLATLLLAEGAKVYEVAIPHTAEGRKQGLDDFLAAHGAKSFLALLNSPETRPATALGTFESPMLLRAHPERS